MIPHRVAAASGLLLLTLAGCQDDPSSPIPPSTQDQHSPPGSVAALTITDLGTLGGLRSEANDINASGQVTGYAWNAAGKSRVFVWDAANGMKDVGLFHPGSGLAINAAGEIAGYLTPPNTVSRAFFFIPGQSNTQLPFPPGGYKNARATDVNDARVVVGHGASTGGRSRAFKWTAAAGLTLLPLLPGSTKSEAYGINSQGWIVGASYGFSTSPNRKRATLWRPGLPPLNLETLLPPGGGTNTATDINDAGDIVGARSLDGRNIGVLWPAGLTHSQDIVAPTASSPAEGINSTGQVVGSAIAPNVRGYIWDAVNGMVVLSAIASPLGMASGATASNPSGTVVGYSYFTPADRHAVLWQ